jgi:hypothetical protein
MPNSPILSLSAVIVLALAGCGKSGSDGEAAGAAAGGDPMKAAEEMAFRFEPGKYRTTITFQKVEIPGMPSIVSPPKARPRAWKR